MATNTASDAFDHDPLLGKTVGGRYAIERLIGRGGVGLVYLAQDRQDSRQVVVKVLAPHWAADRDAVARFDREAQRMAALDHTNVVKMYDHGHFEGRTYIVMEFIRGEPLRRFLNRQKRMPLEIFVPIASQILLGAGYVHERGIMMRDIKPPNIMICEHGGKANHVKLLDFGLAKLIEEDEVNEITKAHVIGTAAYMSPEQIRGDKIDVRVDVYALGVLFFLMLTGEQPISGDNDAAVLVNHVHGKPKSLAERLPKGHRIPPELIALIESCLAKNPDDRPDDATAMAEGMFDILPAPLFEQPSASIKTRAPAETYWASRMNSTSAALAAIQEDVSDSAEWTRPLLRRAAEMGQAPLKLAEAEVAAQKEKAQRPIKRARKATGSGVKPRPRKPTGSGVNPRPRKPTGSGVNPRPRKPTGSGVNPLPTASMGGTPSNATVRVTAADAMEAVERLSEQIGDDDGAASFESRQTDESIPIRPPKKTERSPAVPLQTQAEPSDVVPISMDGDDVEELDEFEEVEEVEEVDDEPSEEHSSSGLVPIPGSGLQQLPTMSSEPLDTGVQSRYTSVGYAPQPANDGMRLGAIVAVAGLAALVLGGLTAILVLGGGDEDSSPAPAVAAAGETPAKAAASAAESDVGTVDVSSAIEGAVVEIDGEDEGKVPVSVELSLGEHRVKVTAEGYHPWQTTIDVKAGANAAVKAELVEADAVISVPAPEKPEPEVSKPKASKPKSSKPKSSKPKSEQSKSSKPKKPKSDVFMDPKKKKDDGIFMPVGGK